MIVKNFKGYVEGQDVSTIPVDRLAYPSKNCFAFKGVVYTRLGIENDGVAAVDNVPIHSEFVWKDSLVGEIPMRCTSTKLQMKYNGLWITIFSGFDSAVVRCRFATWVDSNGTIIKKRLFIVDGSANVYEWTGAIGVIASYDSGAQTITISGSDNLNARGFDDGSSSNYTVTVIRFSGGAVAGTEDKTTDDDCTDKVLHITATLTTAPAVGDIVIQKPISNTPASLSGMVMDEIYNYKNHLVVWNFDSVTVRFSHIQTKLLFTVPAAGSRTALTALNLQLEGAPTAIISKKENNEQVLWMSTKDHWYKLKKLDAINAYDQWIEIQKIETAEYTGSLPYAVSKHKNDIIYMRQDKVLSKISTLEITGSDEFEVISDEVEDLLLRVDTDEMRIYYHQRFIYLVFPQENMLLLLDMIEGSFHAPYDMAMSCLSIIGGTKYGHSSAVDETFYLFRGRNDLGAPIEAPIAFGYHSGEHEFRKKEATIFGVSGRMTEVTKATLNYYHDFDGERETTESIWSGEDVDFFDTAEDDSFATHPFATRSWAGDEAGDEVKRFIAYDRLPGSAYFEARPVFTISAVRGDESNPNVDMEFQLLAWYVDESLSTRKIEDANFITR